MLNLAISMSTGACPLVRDSKRFGCGRSTFSNTAVGVALERGTASLFAALFEHVFPEFANTLSIRRSPVIRTANGVGNVALLFQ